MQDNIEQLQGSVISSVAEGYDAFLLDKFIRASAKDILYIVSDGVSLEHTAEILSFLNPKLEVLKFPA